MASGITGANEPNLRHWIDRLSDRDPGKRLQAVAVPALIEALTDPAQDVRRAAAHVLGEMGAEARAAIPALIQALKDPLEGVRRKAAFALGEMGTEARAAVPALTQCLGDQSAGVRRWAAHALGEIGPTAPAAIPALIESLGAEDVRNRSVSAAALVKMGSRALPRLVDALRHPNPLVRRLAALTLSKSPRSDQAVEDLRKLSEDADATVREAAFEALRRIESK